MKSKRFEDINPKRKTLGTRSQGEDGVFTEPVFLESLGHASKDIFTNDQDVLDWCCALAQESPTALSLLNHARGEGWSVCLDDVGTEIYEIDDEAACITLSHYGLHAPSIGRSSHYKHLIFTNFIKALRDVWHTSQTDDFTASYKPEAILMLERGLAADIITISILVGWELRGAGFGEIWRAILGSDEGDMAMIFTRAIEKDPSGFYDGSVLTRAFCQWYGDEGRVNICDHKTLEGIDDKMAQGFMLSGNHSLRGNDIEKISSLPSDGCYLNGMGQNIAIDPYFVSMNDPINEAHLFHICYDTKAVMVEGVPFRDHKLARLIFPVDQGIKVKE